MLECVHARTQHLAAGQLQGSDGLLARTCPRAAQPRYRTDEPRRRIAARACAEGRRLPAIVVAVLGRGRLRRALRESYAYHRRTEAMMTRVFADAADSPIMTPYHTHWRPGCRRRRCGLEGAGPHAHTSPGGDRSRDHLSQLALAGPRPGERKPAPRVRSTGNEGAELGGRAGCSGSDQQRADKSWAGNDGVCVNLN